MTDTPADSLIPYDEIVQDALRSVVQQTYPHVEHILIDGGSSDNTVALARSQGRTGMVIVSEPDQGIYDAMNKGLRRATGDVVAFLNADDYYAHADVLADVARLLEAENLDAVLADAEFFLQFTGQEHHGGRNG